MSDVHVIIIDTGQYPENVEKLKLLFSPFIVEVYKPSKSQTQAHTWQEPFLDVLRYSKDNNINKSLIIVNDDSMSYSSSEIIKDKVESALSVRNYDLFYLCKWNDEVQKYRHITYDGKEHKGLKWTFSAQGLQCVMFSPHCRDIVVGCVPMRDGKFFKIVDDLDTSIQKAVLNNNLRAVTIVPNLVSFDYELAKTNDDFYKLNEIRDIDESYNNSTNQNVLLNWVFFIVLVIVIIAIAYLIIRLYNTAHGKSSSGPARVSGSGSSSKSIGSSTGSSVKK